jgi:hypothetical protein
MQQQKAEKSCMHLVRAYRSGKSKRKLHIKSNAATVPGTCFDLAYPVHFQKQQTQNIFL